MVDLALCKKLSLAFSKSTGVEYEELFQEACFAWVKWIEDSPLYDKSRGSFRAFATCALRSHFLTYCNKSKTKKLNTINLEKTPSESVYFIATSPSPEEALNWKDKINNVSEEAKFVLSLIFNAPQDFLSHNSPREAVKHLVDELTNKHQFKRDIAKKIVGEIKSLLA